MPSFSQNDRTQSKGGLAVVGGRTQQGAKANDAPAEGASAESHHDQVAARRGKARQIRVTSSLAKFSFITQARVVFDVDQWYQKLNPGLSFS